MPNKISYWLPCLTWFSLDIFRSSLNCSLFGLIFSLSPNILCYVRTTCKLSIRKFTLTWYNINILTIKTILTKKSKHFCLFWDDNPIFPSPLTTHRNYVVRQFVCQKELHFRKYRPFLQSIVNFCLIEWFIFIVKNIQKYPTVITIVTTITTNCCSIFVLNLVFVKILVHFCLFLEVIV